MKKALLLIALAGGWMATQAQDELINKVKDNGGEDGYVFETVINLDATDVKNQGSSGTCWSYCTTSFLESEMIRMGKEPVDVAEMYTVRKTYEDKADKYVRLHGHLNFGQGGALLDVMHVIKYYGAVPQEAYEGLGRSNNSRPPTDTTAKTIKISVKVPAISAKKRSIRYRERSSRLNVLESSKTAAPAIVSSSKKGYWRAKARASGVQRLTHGGQC